MIGRREFLVGAGAAAASLAWPTSRVAAQGTRRPNVLFIAVDDLRPELGCYGRSHMHTPNIDRLAARGVRMDRAYCQMAICGASRTSLLTGMRPDTSGVLWNEQDFRKDFPDHLSIPLHFKRHGYRTVTLGKIYHHGHTDARAWNARVPFDWPGLYALPENQQFGPPRRAEADRLGLKGRERMRFVQGPLTEAADVDDTGYVDGQVATAVGNYLNRPAMAERPWFMAVGLLRPHLPFACPRKYWDFYNPDDIDIDDSPVAPAGVPEFAFHESRELTGYQGKYTDISPHERINDDYARHLIHGYYASTSYADACVGVLLDALERSGQADQTVVVLWGDHGWHLGDHGLWCKHSNFEAATHSPLIVAGPGVVSGAASSALTEFVDVHPTLCELTGLPTPAAIDGRSFASVLTEPGLAHKDAVFSQYPRLAQGWMGYTMRTNRYRYTRWAPHGQNGPDELYDAWPTELYDHATDPGEAVNLAEHSTHVAIRQRLDTRWRSGHAPWRPPSS